MLLQVTLVGDLLGLFAHVVFVIYLAIGRGLRQWLPLFAYVLPMHALTALVSTFPKIFVITQGHEMDSLRTFVGKSKILLRAHPPRQL